MVQYPSHSDCVKKSYRNSTMTALCILVCRLPFSVNCDFTVRKISLMILLDYLYNTPESSAARRTPIFSLKDWGWAGGQGIFFRFRNSRYTGNEDFFPLSPCSLSCSGRREVAEGAVRVMSPWFLIFIVGAGGVQPGWMEGLESIHSWCALCFLCGWRFLDGIVAVLPGRLNASLEIFSNLKIYGLRDWMATPDTRRKNIWRKVEDYFNFFCFISWTVYFGK